VEGHRIPQGNFLHVAIGNKRYAKCKKCGHQQAARLQIHYTKSSMDSVSSALIERIFYNLENIYTSAELSRQQQSF